MILGGEMFQVLRRGAGGSWVNGSFVPGPEETLSLWGSFQPIPGRMLQRLPEGSRTAGGFVLFVGPEEPKLRTSSPGTQVAADVVQRSDGRSYLVVVVEDWTSHTSGVPHMAYGLAEVGTDE